jgi:branched-chain amino acid transport system permease protein
LSGLRGPGKALSPRLRSALVDAVIAAGVAFALFCLTLGVRTGDSAQGLTLTPRPLLLATVVGIIFVGRLALNLFWWNRSWRLPKSVWWPLPWTLPKFPLPKVARERASGHFGALALVIFAALFPIVAYALDSTLHLNLPLRYLLDLSILVLTYVMLGWGLNIVVGLAGLLDLGYVAFYAVGAYTFALLATTFGWSFWICLPFAGLLAALWGIMLGFPVLRLRGDYLAIVTLAFGEIVRIVLLNWTNVTNGPNGISDIPKPTFFGLPLTKTAEGGGETFSSFFGIAYDPLHAVIFLYYVIFALALLTNLVTLRLRRLPIGRAWEAMREDEIACRSLGINTTITKLTAFATGALFGGIAGSFFATRQGFISPESFTFIESAIILAIVVLGGMGSQLGVALAAIVMVGGFEALRHTSGLKVIFGPDFDPALYRMLLFGVAMVAFMVWRPRGIVGSREPSIMLKSRRAGKGDPVKAGRA